MANAFNNEEFVQTVPALIGLFSISQVLIQAENAKKPKAEQQVGELKGRMLPTRKEMLMLLPNFIRSAVLGVVVGILPGAGGDIGGWVGYNEAKRFSKHKEEFGKGSIEGICGSETANNAVTGGALIPMMTLGIPGSSAAAVLLGGFMIHGLAPGHSLFTKQADTTYAIILGFMLANIIMDSAGTMTPDQVTAYVKAMVAKVSIPVAFHGHNNLGLSVANALAAAAFQRRGMLMDVDLMKLLAFEDEKLIPAMEKYNYHVAVKPFDLILGLAGAHSSFTKMFKEVAAEKGVGLYPLILEVSRINQKNPDRALTEEVADRIKAGR